MRQSQLLHNTQSYVPGNDLPYLILQTIRIHSTINKPSAHIAFQAVKSVVLAIGFWGDFMRSFFTTWNSKGVFNGPALAPNSISQCARINSKLFGPLSNGLSFSVKKENNILSSIVVLGGNISPSAIFFKISFGAINSIKGMSFWTFPHILVKPFKLLPLITNRDSTRNVITIGFGSLFGATSIFHRTPSNISWSSILTVSVLTDRLNFFLQASAGFCVAVKEILHSYNNLFSASTTTIPHSVSAHIWSATNDSETFNILTSKVIKLRHAIPYILDCGRSEYSGCMPFVKV